MSGALATARTFGSLLAVLGLLGLFVWALRRGSLKLSSLTSHFDPMDAEGTEMLTATCLLEF